MIDDCMYQVPVLKSLRLMFYFEDRKEILIMSVMFWPWKSPGNFQDFHTTHNVVINMTGTPNETIFTEPEIQFMINFQNSERFLQQS